MPPFNNFQALVDHVQPGSPVSATNTSQSTRELEGRTNWLYDMITNITAGQTLVQTGQPLSAAVLDGQAVFWNNLTSQYEPAISAVATDPDAGTLITAPSSDVIGIVNGKDSNTSDTIILTGMLSLTPAQLANLIADPDPTPGRYYLSAIHPGQLTKQKPPVTVSVAYLLGPPNTCETNSTIYINPQMRDFIDNHVHYQFRLFPLPAGTTTEPSYGDPHVITNPDVNMPGWLPAGHASFNGMAPPNAKFGYNLKYHKELHACWPPIPVQAAVFEMFKPDHINQLQIAGRVMPELVQMDNYGIWWMSDCYDTVPWPTDYVSTNTDEQSSLSMGLVDDHDCPVVYKMREIVSFVKMTFLTADTVVTSLVPATGAPIKITNTAGAVASTDDLQINLNTAAMLSPTPVYGGNVLKTIIDNQLVFGAGYVTEGILAGSSNMIISGTQTRGLNPALPVSDSNPQLYQGIVTVDVQLDPSNLEYYPEIMRLGDAVERSYLNVDYIGFPTGRTSAIRMRFNVPPSGLPNSPVFKLRAQMFGLVVGPFPAMTLTYNQIVSSTASSPTSIANGVVPVTFDIVTPSSNYGTTSSPLPAGSVMQVESDTFSVNPGDTLFLTLTRLSSATPSYASDVGLLRVSGVIAAGS